MKVIYESWGIISLVSLIIPISDFIYKVYKKNTSVFKKILGFYALCFLIYLFYAMYLNLTYRQVPNLINCTISTAEGMLFSNDLICDKSGDDFFDYYFTVESQSIEPGEIVKKGTTITITYSTKVLPTATNTETIESDGEQNIAQTSTSSESIVQEDEQNISQTSTSSESIVQEDEQNIFPTFIVSITNPIEGAIVPLSYCVKGELTGDIPKGTYLWIFVNPSDSSNWWPEGSPLVAWEGKWSTNIALGDANSSGQSFNIYVVSVDEQDNQFLINYQTNGQSTGVYPAMTLPESAQLVTRVNCVRE